MPRYFSILIIYNKDVFVHWVIPNLLLQIIVPFEEPAKTSRNTFFLKLSKDVKTVH